MTNTAYPGISEAVSEVRAELVAERAPTSTTIGVFLKDQKRLYTYQCSYPVEVGDRVNVKLPSQHIITVRVEEVHPTPQLSDKWETKWAVVVQTRQEAEDAAFAAQNQSSDLGKELGL